MHAFQWLVKCRTLPNLYHWTYTCKCERELAPVKARPASRAPEAACSHNRTSFSATTFSAVESEPVHGVKMVQAG